MSESGREGACLRNRGGEEEETNEVAYELMTRRAKNHRRRFNLIELERDCVE